MRKTRVTPLNATSVVFAMMMWMTACGGGQVAGPIVTPTPTPTPTATPTPTPVPTPTPTPAPAARVLSAVSPGMVSFDGVGDIVPISLSCTGCQPTDKIQTVGSIQGSNDFFQVNLPSITGTYEIDRLRNNAGVTTIDACDSSLLHCSSSVAFGSIGNGQNPLVVTPAHQVLLLDPGNSLVHVFDANRAHVKDCSIKGNSIAFDNVGTGRIIAATPSVAGTSVSVGIFDLATCSNFSSLPVSGSSAGVAALNGLICYARPVEGDVQCAPDQAGPAAVSASAGVGPYAVQFATLAGKQSLVVLSRGDATNAPSLRVFTVTDTTVTLVGSALSLSGAISAGGSPQLVAFDAGTAVIRKDGKLVGVNLATNPMTVLWTTAVSAPGTTQIAPDPVGARVLMSTWSATTRNATVSPFAISSGLAQGASVTTATPAFFFGLGLDGTIAVGGVQGTVANLPLQ